MINENDTYKCEKCGRVTHGRNIWKPFCSNCAKEKRKRKDE